MSIAGAILALFDATTRKCTCWHILKHVPSTYFSLSYPLLSLWRQTRKERKWTSLYCTLHTHYLCLCFHRAYVCIGAQLVAGMGAAIYGTECVCVYIYILHKEMGRVLTIWSHSFPPLLLLLLPPPSSPCRSHLDMLAVNVLSKAYTNYNGYLTDNVTDTPVCKWV